MCAKFRKIPIKTLAVGTYPENMCTQFQKNQAFMRIVNKPTDRWKAITIGLWSSVNGHKNTAQPIFKTNKIFWPCLLCPNNSGTQKRWQKYSGQTTPLEIKWSLPKYNLPVINTVNVSARWSGWVFVCFVFPCTRVWFAHSSPLYIGPPYLSIKDGNT